MHAVAVLLRLGIWCVLDAAGSLLLSAATALRNAWLAKLLNLLVKIHSGLDFVS